MLLMELVSFISSSLMGKDISVCFHLLELISGFIVLYGKLLFCNSHSVGINKVWLSSVVLRFVLIAMTLLVFLVCC
jgi:hypothetical protein